MTNDPRPTIKRHIALTDADVETVEDAVEVLAELDTVRPHEMTSLLYAAQYDSLQILLRDLLRIFGLDD